MCSMSAGSVNSKETEASNSLNEQYRIALLSPDGTVDSGRWPRLGVASSKLMSPSQCAVAEDKQG